MDVLASFVTTATAAALPDLDRQILRRHAIDCVVTRLAGARTSEGRELMSGCPSQSLAEKIALAGGLIRLTEMDDIHIESTTTPSSVTVPVALGLASVESGDPRVLEDAIYVATELVVRFGKAMDGSRALLKGIWPTRAAASLGACAAAARIWKLDEGRTKHALGLALAMSMGRSPAFDRIPSGRWVLFSQALDTGLRAAMAGRAGFSGGATPMTQEWIAAALGTDFDMRLLTDDLGAGSIYPELSLKPYATSRQTLSAADAMLKLVAEGLDPKTVRTVTIHVPKAHERLVGSRPNPDVRNRNFMSAALQVAVAALRPDELFNAEREQVVNDPDVLAFSRLCSVVGDDGLEAVFPDIWGAHVDVVAAAGARRQTIMHPSGSPENRMDDRQFALKSERILSACGLSDRAADLLYLGEKAFDDASAARRLGEMILSG